MARRCSICDHPEREAIDKALINNVSYRKIVERYGTTGGSLTRHKHSHIAELLGKSEEIQSLKAAAVQGALQEKEAQEAGQADTLLSQVKELMARTERIFIKTEEAGDMRAALQAIREGRGNLELLGKLIGELQDGVTINLYNHPVWIDLRAVILTALAPYPEAKEALIYALSRPGK